MKSIRTIAALAAVLGLGSYAQAGLLGHRLGGCGASKCCDCAPTSQPTCCKPTIVKPCHRNVYNYQRTCAKPMECCNSCAPANGCGPTACANGDAGACVNGGAGAGACAPGAAACAAPCGAGNGCTTAPACAAPCGAGAGNGCVNHNNNGCAAPCGNGNACVSDPGCAAPCDPGCAAPADPGCAAPCDTNACCPTKGCGLFGHKKCGLFGGKLCGGKLFGHCKAGCCDAGCCDDPCVPVCCEDNSCEIAELIYKSQTACYAKDRAKAIHKLGDKYDCVCNPEIMSAFIYALNDADERVREKAADEIGDQIRKNGCCCSPCLTAALTNALADCDRGVRKEAEQALRLCGYDVVDGCCDTCDLACSNTGCGPTGCGPAPVPTQHAAPVEGAAPAPAPAPPTEQPKAYSPKPQQNQLSSRKSLSNLFGMVR